jgi:hypothetical protein
MTKEESLLHVSVRIGNLEAVRLMLSYGMDVNTRFGPYNSLQWSILHRQIEVYRYLVNRFGDESLRMDGSFDGMTITATCLAGDITIYNEVFGTVSTIDSTIQETLIADTAVSIIKLICTGNRLNFDRSIEDFAKLILHVESRMEIFGLDYINQKCKALVNYLVLCRHYDDVIKLVKIGFSIESYTVDYLLINYFNENRFNFLKDLYKTGSQKIHWQEIISYIIKCDKERNKFFNGIILDKRDMKSEFVRWIQRQIMGPFKLKSIVNRAVKDYISNQEPRLLIGEVPKSLIDALHPFDVCSEECCV